MAVPRGLVLYGDSVFLAGLKAALSQYDALEPILIESGRPGISGHIQALNPHAVLFDRSAAQPDFVLRLLVEGRSNKMIMRELDLSESTVKTHLQAIFRRLGVSSRTQAVVAAARLGLQLA